MVVVGGVVKAVVIRINVKMTVSLWGAFGPSMKVGVGGGGGGVRVATASSAANTQCSHKLMKLCLQGGLKDI